MAEATTLERARLKVRGVRAELVLEDGRMTLSKEGSPPSSRTFPVDQVRGTVFEPGSRGGRGWIHIAVVGGTLAPPSELAAMSDPYTLPLPSRSAVAARRLARMVEKHLHERGLPSEPAFAESALTSGRYSSGVALTRAPLGEPARGEPTHQAGAVVATAQPRIVRVAVPSAPPADGRSDDPPDEQRHDAEQPDGVSRADDLASGTLAGAPTDELRDAVETAAAETAMEQRARTSVPPTSLPGPVSSSSSRSVPTTGASRSPAPTQPPPSDPPERRPPPPPSGTSRALAAELRQLGELHEAGVLTLAEFEQAKARVLS